jgi:hypothetical protein
MSLADKAGLKQDDLLDVLGLGAMANPMFGELTGASTDTLLQHCLALCMYACMSLHHCVDPCGGTHAYACTWRKAL